MEDWSRGDRELVEAGKSWNLGGIVECSGYGLFHVMSGDFFGRRIRHHPEKSYWPIESSPFGEFNRNGSLIDKSSHSRPVGLSMGTRNLEGHETPRDYSRNVLRSPTPHLNSKVARDHSDVAEHPAPALFERVNNIVTHRMFHGFLTISMVPPSTDSEAFCS